MKSSSSANSGQGWFFLATMIISARIWRKFWWIIEKRILVSILVHRSSGMEQGCNIIWKLAARVYNDTKGHVILHDRAAPDPRDRVSDYRQDFLYRERCWSTWKSDFSRMGTMLQWFVIPVQVGAVERVPSLQLIVAEPSKVYPELQVAV